MRTCSTCSWRCSGSFRFVDSLLLVLPLVRLAVVPCEALREAFWLESRSVRYQPLLSCAETDHRYPYPLRDLLPLPHPSVSSPPSLLAPASLRRGSQSLTALPSLIPSFPTVTFLRTSVLPKVPAAPAGAAKNAPSAVPTSAGAKLSKTIQVRRLFSFSLSCPCSRLTKLILLNFAVQIWVKANYEKAMLFVAFIEVGLVFGRLLLGGITFQNSCVRFPLPSSSSY